MPISIDAGPDFTVKLDNLKDLANELETKFKLVTETPSDFKKKLSDVPDTTKIDVHYDTGNLGWAVGGVAFGLDAGGGGRIKLHKSGTLYDYTDGFPTEVQLSLDTQDNSGSSTTPFNVEPGAIYVEVELDFSVAGGVSFATAPTAFGLSFNAAASTSDSFTVAFYKKCGPDEIFAEAIGKAFSDLVLPFHANTIAGLGVGDVLRHNAGANLQLGMGAGIGFSGFTVASQFTKGIPNLANSPTLTVGMNPLAAPAAGVAYSFGYAGAFEQTLLRDGENSARLHIYRSSETAHAVSLDAGVTFIANAGGTIAVQQQILDAPKNATSNPALQKALSTAFSAASDAIGSLAGAVNDKIAALLGPINQAFNVGVNATISKTRQNFLLTDYTIDLTKNEYSAAWTDMIKGRFVDALSDGKGRVQLAVGSGLEKLYAQTASFSLNFFGQAAAQWSTSSIENSKLVYAGNNMFHLITADGLQRRALIGDVADEVDVYFSLDLALAAGGASADARPDLNVIMKATSNPEFGLRIAKAFVDLTRDLKDPDVLRLEQKIMDSRQVANSTQLLHVIIPEQAYQGLKFSKVGLADDGADRNNYAKFADASNMTMPEGTPARFQFGHFKLDYDFWRTWNIAVTDKFPPPEGSQPDRKGTGPADAAQGFLDPKFGADSAVRTNIAFTMNSASEFMNLCEALARLCGEQVNMADWEAFAESLRKIAEHGPDFDFIVPTALALTQLCGGKPALTVGPAPGLPADSSVAVTMTLPGGVATGPGSPAPEETAATR